jgi:hypothetical protein
MISFMISLAAPQMRCAIATPMNSSETHQLILPSGDGYCCAPNKEAPAGHADACFCIER